MCLCVCLYVCPAWGMSVSAVVYVWKPGTVSLAREYFKMNDEKAGQQARVGGVCLEKC